MKADDDQPASHLLRRRVERLLALALAEVQLRGSWHGRLDDAVAQLPRLHLVKPDTIETWVLSPDDAENPFPGSRFKRQGFVRAAKGRLARRLGR